VRHAARGKLRNAVLHNVSHAPRRRSRYDGDAKPQDRSTARACICAQDAHAFPPSSVDARTDNRYSVTPTLAGDKGLNGRPADARVTPTVMHRRNAPTKSVDLERAAPHRALCPSVYSFFVTKARYSACKRRAHARAYSHTCVPHGVT